MSNDFNQNDLARLLALEHAFCSLALMSASNFAFLAATKPSDAVNQFRSAIEGSMLDTKEYPKDVNTLMQAHLKRIFDHIAQMAVHADLGWKN
jgi:hypothetical protein